MKRSDNNLFEGVYQARQSMRFCARALSKLKLSEFSQMTMLFVVLMPDYWHTPVSFCRSVNLYNFSKDKACAQGLLNPICQFNFNLHLCDSPVYSCCQDSLPWSFHCCQQIWRRLLVTLCLLQQLRPEAQKTVNKLRKKVLESKPNMCKKYL